MYKEGWRDLINTTQAKKWIDEARPLIKFIEEQGGPIFKYEIAQGDNGKFFMFDPRGDSVESIDDSDLIVHSICMWIMDVGVWYQTTTDSISSSPIPLRGRWVSQVGIGICITKITHIDEPTKELAFLAQLKAICTHLGYKENQDA